MGVNYEDHRKSPHRIDILNSLCCHFFGKSTEKSSYFCFFRQKILLLPYERTNQLDRLGKGTGSYNCRVLSLTTISGVVLLSLSASMHHYHLLLFLRLFKKRSRQHPGELEKILARAHLTLFII